VKPAGLLLAAGAGKRMGGPKGLVRDTAGVPWAVRAVRVLRQGGCAPIAVVVGASGDTLAALLTDEGVRVVHASAWETGMASSLRSGLTWLEQTDAPAAVIHLVDLPDVSAAVVRRVVASGGRGSGGRGLGDRSGSGSGRGSGGGSGEGPGGGASGGEDALVRAAYRGVPGHPVLLGRTHWARAWSAAQGDRGAGAYLAAAGCALVECGDLASGNDQDTPLPPPS
jgi:CTP:molybdopterin cytidylyltransferase MocA